MPNWKFVRIPNSTMDEDVRVYIYSSDMGKIVSYIPLYSTGYCCALRVQCENISFLIDQKASASRVRSYTTLFLPDIESEKQKELESEREKIESLFEEKRDFIPSYARNTVYLTDPRLIRAHILASYEDFKETPLDKINALLNRSVDMPIDEAAEWMRRNDFRYSTEFQIFDSNPHNSDYLFDPGDLKDPYWGIKKGRLNDVVV